jgi:hypothetical protein
VARVSVNRVLQLQRQQLAAVIEHGSVRRLRKTYEDARRDLLDRLNTLMKTGRGETFTAHSLRLVLIQLQQTLAEFNTQFGAQLVQEGAVAKTLSQRHLVTAVNQLEKKFRGVTPVLQSERAGLFRRAYTGVDPSLLNRYQQSVSRYGQPLIAKVRNELAQSVLTNETVDEAVDRVAGTNGVFKSQRWRAERIVRTETAYSYGVTKHRSMEALRDADYPQLKKKLVATFDSRTGEDSKELHGQVRNVDEPFVWHVKNSKGQVVKTVEYMYPPNRPNDREVSIPWLDEWAESEVTKPRSA